MWGFDPGHRYTFKALEPKVGAAGCMSLQYHHEKSETWLMLRGEIWVLFIVDGAISTRIMRARDGQHITPGIIHRMAGITADAQVLEPSTPDAHAADKTAKKDVVRLHCMHGRECVPGRSEAEQKLVADSVTIADAAMVAIAAGRTPEEINPALMDRFGAFKLP